jgi:hypothetical protein
MDSYLARKNIQLRRCESSQWPAITGDLRLESEYFASASPSPRIKSELPQINFKNKITFNRRELKAKLTL